MRYTLWFRKSIDFGPLIKKGFVTILLPSARDLLAVFWPLITTLTPLALLLKIRLHQPADVAELQNGIKDSRDLCFSRGVAYIAERGNACIRFEDLDGKVRLSPNSLRSRADLQRTLTDYNLSIDGTVPTLRKHLSQHLLQLEARVTKNMLQIDVPLSMPAAVCVASDDLLLCADDGHRVVYQIQLERNGVTINGKLRKL